MKFSLIIGTINRMEVLSYCLDAIRRQTYRKFELIIIDQSYGKETENLVKKIDWCEVHYLHVNYIGLSRARNDALRLATGDYFCLIDDDAEYSENYLETVKQKIDNGGDKYIYTGFIYDNIKKRCFCKYDAIKKNNKLNTSEILKYCPSAALIIPMDFYKKFGGFDERFGVGGEYGAGEETDLLLRAKKNGYNVSHIKEMKLNHPILLNNNENIDRGMNSQKAFSYSVGIGALYKKHMIINHNLRLFPCFITRIIKLYIKSILGNLGYAKEQIKGTIHGMRKYNL